MRTIGKYKIVGPHVDFDDAQVKQLVLDANVLLDIRDFYFTGPARFAHLKSLLLEFPMDRRKFVDINYGWATSELSWVRGKGLDPIRRRRLIHAADHVLSWDSRRIEREFANRHPPERRDRTWPGRSPVETDLVNTDPRILLIAQYGALLYLFQLERRRAERKSRGREWALTQTAEWMTNTLGVRTSYVFALAIGFFAGSSAAQNDVRRILKFDGSETPDQIASKCWNVAWDILMTGLGEGLSYGLLDDTNARATALVTADKDPTLLRAAAHLGGLITDRTEKIPFAAFGMELHASVTQDAVDRAFGLDYSTSILRFSRDPEEVACQVARAVNDLEVELGMTNVTSHDGWMLGNSQDP
jgi:hypothetical protein